MHNSTTRLDNGETVRGQNGIGQKGTDKMIWTKWYG